LRGGGARAIPIDMATHQRFDKRGRRGATRQTGPMETGHMETGRPAKPPLAARAANPADGGEKARPERSKPADKRDPREAKRSGGRKAKPFPAARAAARPEATERPRFERDRSGERDKPGDKRDHREAKRPGGHKAKPFPGARAPARPEASERPRFERDKPAERDRPGDKRDRRGTTRPSGGYKAKPFPSARPPAQQEALETPRPPRPAPPPLTVPIEVTIADRAPAPAQAPRYGGDWLYGRHAVAAALANPARRIRHVVALAESAEAATALVAAARARLPAEPQPQILLRDALEKLLPDGAVHQGIAIAAESLPALAIDDIIAHAGAEPAPGAPPQVIVLLDQVSDPHNVGAVLRSAAAFGALALVLPEHGAPYVTGVLAKAASGAIEHVPIVRVVNLARTMDRLKAAGFWCVGLDGAAERSLPALSLGGRLALVLGAEGDGMRRLTRERCDLIARLPTPGVLASLNVSNAAAIALYELHRAASLTPPAG
jgi:23S rRNA (guanosine2251-2'-O)-methyltransferase